MVTPIKFKTRKAKTNARNFAKHMRHLPTEAERRFWTIVRGRRIANLKFRRQVPVGPYIADFLCAEEKLIVEIDGSQHCDSPQDIKRDRYLRAHGFRVLRFWNNDVLANTDSVADAVYAVVTGK